MKKDNISGLFDCGNIKVILGRKIDNWRSTRGLFSHYSTLIQALQGLKLSRGPADRKKVSFIVWWHLQLSKLTVRTHLNRDPLLSLLLWQLFMLSLILGVDIFCDSCTLIIHCPLDLKAIAPFVPDKSNGKSPFTAFQKAKCPAFN